MRHKRISKRGNAELRNRLVFGRLPFDLWPIWDIMAETNHHDNNKVLNALYEIRKYKINSCNIHIYIRKSVIEFGMNSIVFEPPSVADERSVRYMAEASRVFMSSLEKLCMFRCVPSINVLIISVTTVDAFENLKWSTNESYELRISNNDGKEGEKNKKP